MPATLQPWEMTALRRFARENGAHWKSKLRTWWMNPGVISTKHEHHLYMLRNTHGPSWLVKFRFPIGVRPLHGR